MTDDPPSHRLKDVHKWEGTKISARPSKRNSCSIPSSMRQISPSEQRRGHSAQHAVPSYPQYLEAAKAARRIVGVTSVRNHLEVALPPVNYRDDAYDTDPADISQHMRSALARHALVPDDSDVAADTFGSVVRLTGHVRTRAEHDAVVGATWMATGVTAVIDELEVTS
jgi:osmotically-inducible protein OsmY